LTEKTISLDAFRGMAAQKATEVRRMLAEVEADQVALKARQDELEHFLLAAPAADWHEAVAKASYLIGLLKQTSAAADPRRTRLIADVLADFDRLLDDIQHASGGTRQERRQEPTLAKGQKRAIRETRKPKKEQPKQAPGARSPLGLPDKPSGASRKK
jgi:hypothetical protein